MTTCNSRTVEDGARQQCLSDADAPRVDALDLPMKFSAAHLLAARLGLGIGTWAQEALACPLIDASSNV
jgi:hypothetical protein